MSFTYSLATDTGKVRLAISDTGGVGPGETATTFAFHDAEIGYFLTTGGTVEAASILAMRQLLGSKALRTKQFSVGGQFYNDSAAIAGIREWLKLHGGEMPTVVVTMPALQPFDSNYTETG